MGLYHRAEFSFRNIAETTVSSLDSLMAPMTLGQSGELRKDCLRPGTQSAAISVT